MHKSILCLFGCLLLLSGCFETVPSKDSNVDQVFCINLPISDFSSYPVAYTPAQCLAKENTDPKVIEKVNEESRKIWREIHAKMHLTTPYIPMFVYGSLMNPVSAKNTLEEYRPHAVWLHNYVRTFDLDVDLLGGSTRLTEADGPQNRGFLNLKHAPGKSCNGIVLAIGEDDFVACRRREGVYEFVPVLVSDYGSSNKCSHSVAFAWIAGPQACSSDVLPVKGYYSMIWFAVASDDVKEDFGDNFAQDYLDTTFLANGESIKTVHEEYKDSPLRY
ncbi:gamma-glutamylcyclotransferase family protein [Chlamydia sp. 04-14]|uniref:gamma-glutamylcyclotransferase family protein n=1 Tax=Chlamydia TaxID=810 RepID=UPI002FC7A520